jgi:WD40 repeat protein
VVAAVGLLCACDRVFTVHDLPDATVPDAEHWTCPALPPFETWVNAQLSVPTAAFVRHPTVDITRDELMFSQQPPSDILVTKFSAPTAPVVVTTLSSAASDTSPSLWEDHDHMYLMHGAMAVEGTRNGTSWTVASLNLPADVGGAQIGSPAATPDHGFRVIVATTAGELAELARIPPDSAFHVFDTLRLVDDPATPESDPYLSPDGCWLLFSSSRPPSANRDLWASLRGPDGQFTPAVRLTQQSAGLDDDGPSLSSDLRHLLWSQNGQLMHAHP